jgi:hypothetical protein
MTALFIIAASLLARSAASDDAKSVPTLGGLWKLNEKQSETLQQKMAEHGGGGGGGWGGHRGGMGGGMGGGGGYGGGGGGGWGGHRHGGGEGGESGRQGEEGTSGSGGPEGAPPDGRSADPMMRSLARPPLTMLVEQTDSTVVLSERGQTIEVITLGDVATAAAAVEPESPHVQAKWRGTDLVAERTSDRGGKMSQTFELSKDAKQLIVITHRDSRGDRPAIDLKRVYDHYEGD